MLKAEKCVNQGINRLLQLEETLDIFTEQVAAQEAGLLERRQQLRRGEQAAAADLEHSELAAEESRSKVSTFEERQSMLLDGQAALDGRRREVQARTSLAEAKRRELDAERAIGARLQQEVAEGCESVARAEATLEALSKDVAECAEQLMQVASSVVRRRGQIRGRQDVLDLVRAELQSEDAALTRRRSQLEANQVALAAREAELATAGSGLAELRARAARAKEEVDSVERRLASLWDDIHQRQLVVDDICSTLRAREDRVGEVQRSLACEGASTSDAAQLHVELSAAGLADRAWRDRSAALADREAELQARLRLLKAQAAQAHSFE